MLSTLPTMTTLESRGFSVKQGELCSQKEENPAREKKNMYLIRPVVRIQDIAYGFSLLSIHNSVDIISSIIRLLKIAKAAKNYFKHKY